MNSPNGSKTLITFALTLVAVVALGVDWRLFQAGAQVIGPPPPSSSLDPQLDALRRLQVASETPLRVTFTNGFPHTVTARVETEGNNAVERAQSFLRQYRDLYAQNSPHLALKVRHVNTPPNEDVLFYQTYRGLEVFGAGLLVSLDQRTIFHTGGALVIADTKLDPQPNIFEREAEAIVRQQLELQNAGLAAETTLMVFDRSLLDSSARRNARLAWRVTLDKGEIQQVFVDAHTGRLLLILPSVLDSGGSLHGFDLDMRDAEDEANAQDDNCYWGSDDVDVADEDEFNSDYNDDPDAVKGFAHIKNVYAFFHNNFNRHSYDDEYSEIELFIHSTTGGSAAWITDCSLIQVETGKVSFDLLGHEFTHAIISDTSQLVYALDSGALNESYADILGVIADQELEQSLGQPTDWTLAEDKTGGGPPFRSLSSPPDFGQPDHILDSNAGLPAPCPSGLNFPAAKCNDYGGVHRRSGIPNKTAFLMAVGGIHPDNGLPVVGMGRNKMRDLKWHAATHLPYFADFQLAAGFELATAEKWAANGTSGFTSASVCSVKNAWAAVGFGQPDSDCDGIDNVIDPDPDGDFIPTGPDNCATVGNPSQKNTDNDSLGDACDPDDDNDGVPDQSDNCPTVANPPGISGQPPCNDLDDDDVIDTVDNCVGDFNPSQQDSDGDGEGDVCEVDSDSDGLSNDNDNCPFVDNSDQANADGDAYGDACDRCPNTNEPNPKFGKNGMPLQPDSDGDGTPDACDLSILYDGRTLMFGSIKPDRRFREADVEALPATSQRMPLFICDRDCPEWFDRNDQLRIVLRDLDESTRVWVADESGQSVKKATGPTGRREIAFKPLAGRSYYLTFTFRAGGAERDEFRMKFSSRGIKPRKLPRLPRSPK